VIKNNQMLTGKMTVFMYSGRPAWFNVQ